MGATCFPLGATTSAQHLEMMGRLQPTLFVGTPSYCRHVATVAAAEGIDLVANSVERLLVGGEPGGSLAGTKEALERRVGG